MTGVPHSPETTAPEGVAPLGIGSSLILVGLLVTVAAVGLLLGGVFSAGLAVVAGFTIELPVALLTGAGAVTGVIVLRRRMGGDHAGNRRLATIVLLVFLAAGLAPGTMFAAALYSFNSIS